MSEQERANPSTRDEVFSKKGNTANTRTEPKFCKLVVKLDPKGQAEIIDADECCKKILEESPPVRQAFWTRRLSEDVRKKLGLTDKKESQ
jgi:hypothetical protein